MPQCYENYMLKYSTSTKIISVTRMHSSRMRTGRLLTVCRSLLPGGVCFRGSVCSGGVSAPGGCLLLGGGCLLPGGVCSGVVSALGGVASQHALRQTPPNRMTDRCKNITLATTSLRPIINSRKVD